MGFLQVVFGYVAGRIIISVVLVPLYLRGEMFTAYELIERRFGQKLRSFTAAIFLLTRSAADGVRVFAIALVVGIALGPLLGGMDDFKRDVISIGIITALTLIYTFEGGVRAVIWTDVVQLAIYIIGTVTALFTIAHLMPEGWSQIFGTGLAAQKFRVFDFSLDFSRVYTFWAGFIGGGFLTMASHGTDQMIVQRLLIARNERDAKTALVSSGFIVLAQFVLFLFLGVALFAFYQAFPPEAGFDRSDRIFPFFIVSQLPGGLAGLLVAAILAAAMSTISSSLNSLSSTTVMDLYSRLSKETSEERKLKLSRFATVGWALIIFVLAILARKGGRAVELGLSVASISYGALLGVFFLGVLTRRANQSGAIVGMSCSLVLMLCVWFWDAIPWPWYVVMGTAATFAIGYMASLALSDGARGNTRNA
jgi:SSS family solute:Na+ symporter